VLNEPETSLHPDLLPALGRLIANAAERSQVLVVTHAPRLIAALEEHDDCNSVRLEKEFGETKVVDAEALYIPTWRWASR
jgi:predicted ATPase